MSYNTRTELNVECMSKLKTLEVQLYTISVENYLGKVFDKMELYFLHEI